MQVTYSNGIFSCICSYSEKDYAKDAGFVWDKIIPKTWATKDAGCAYKLIKYADAKALPEISKFMQQAVINMDASRAKESSAKIPCPEGLEYLPFQKAGIDFIIKTMVKESKAGILLGDEMGVGKTIQAVGVINCLRECIPDPMILVVCPASLKLNWLFELKRWLVKPMVCEKVDSNQPWPDARCYVINYDILIQPCICCRGMSKEDKAKCPTCLGAGSYSKFPQLYDMEWDLIIADEAHRLKNAKGKQAEAFFKMLARHKLPMTGTPMLSRPIEIWPLLNWIDKEAWGNKYMFGKRYCNLTKGRFGLDWSGNSNLGELQTRLRGGGYLLRRLKADVLTELPPKFRQVIELPADGCESILANEWKAFNNYEAVLRELNVACQLAKASDNDDHYHAAVDKLREGQAAAFQEMALVRKEVALKKLPMCIAHLKDAVSTEHKVVAMAWHRDVVKGVCNEFKDSSVSITGDTPPNDRQEIVRKFQQVDSVCLFVGNMKAAGVGLTLTKSSHVVFLELDWVPANITQAEDRCHRIGQMDSVLVQHLVLEGSIDAVMAKKIIEKQKVIRKALDAPCEDQVETIDIGKEESCATEKTTRKEVVLKCITLMPHHISIIHTALRHISSLCNHARNVDAKGFSKMDAEIGFSLASAPRLSQKQGYLGLKIVRKYHAQMPEDMQQAIKEMMI